MIFRTDKTKLFGASSRLDWLVYEPVDVYADNWIDHPTAHRYGIREDSRKIGNDMVLSLLWWEDESQILEL